MTPSEKAKELINKLMNGWAKTKSCRQYNIAKQCALICVDEILNTNPRALPTIIIGGKKHFVNDNGKTYCNKNYWREVKQEIEKL